MRDAVIAFLIILFFTGIIFGSDLINSYREKSLLEAYKAELDAGFDPADSRVIEFLKDFYGKKEK